MSHHRENSARDKVIGKKWIYLEKPTPQSDCGPSQRMNIANECVMVGFYGLGNFIGHKTIEWS